MGYWITSLGLIAFGFLGMFRRVNDGNDASHRTTNQASGGTEVGTRKNQRYERSADCGHDASHQDRGSRPMPSPKRMVQQA